MRYVAYGFITLIATLVVLNNTGALRIMVGWFEGD